MKDLLDVHTHTTASGHAYGTLHENILAAKAKGLELIGISDHAPQMPGSANELYFLNFRVIPREISGVKVMMGAELNILDYSGSTDLSARALKSLDYAIASLHDPCIDAGNVAENTAALIGAMKNPCVVIIGHPDNPNYPVDFEKLAKAAADNHVLLELNNTSYDPQSHRAGSRENAKLMLAACKKFSASVIMGSDAHINFDVGNHKFSQEVLKENNFPQELIVNDDVKKFLNFVKFRKILTPS